MTKTMGNANMEILKDLYFKLLSTQEGSDTMEIFYNPVMHKAKNDLYFEILSKMKTNYDLKDMKVFQELIKIDIEYRIIKKECKRKYNKSTKNYDVDQLYDKSLSNIVSILDDANLFDDGMVIRYFTLMKKYDEIHDKELLKEFYESYYSDKPNDLSSMFELYKILRPKGMPDTDFKEIFGDENYKKIIFFIEKSIQNLTMSN